MSKPRHYVPQPKGSTSGLRPHTLHPLPPLPTRNPLPPLPTFMRGASYPLHALRAHQQYASDQQSALPDVSGWYASIKYNGIRVSCTDRGIYTRGGTRLRPPRAWMQAVEHFRSAHCAPHLSSALDLDAELVFCAAGTIEGSACVGTIEGSACVGAIDSHHTMVHKALAHEDWDHLCLYVFDVIMPNDTYNAPASARQAMLHMALGAKSTLPRHGAHVAVVAQHALPAGFEEAHRTVYNWWREATTLGAEGLMLTNPYGLYTQSGTRTKQVLKVKLPRQGYAEVVGYTAGTGKYTGMIGALMCRWLPSSMSTQPSDMRAHSSDVVWHVGTGLKDSDRIFANAPSIGSIILVSYYDITATGRPEHPTLLSC